jgi:hypothetical protein
MKTLRKRGGIPTCAQCARLVSGEVFRLTHQEHDSSPVDEEKVFCCRVCLDEYFEGEAMLKVEAAVRKETNDIAKLVCPACKRRIRRAG